jgi:hypothetical protein
VLTRICVLFSVLKIHITSKFGVLGLVQSKYLYFPIFTQHCDQFWCARIALCDWSTDYRHTESLSDPFPAMTGSSTNSTRFKTLSISSYNECHSKRGTVGPQSWSYSCCATSANLFNYKVCSLWGQYHCVSVQIRVSSHCCVCVVCYWTIPVSLEKCGASGHVTYSKWTEPSWVVCYKH